MTELWPVPPPSGSRTAPAKLPPASPPAGRRAMTSYWSRPVCDARRGPRNSPADHPETPNGELAIGIGRSLGTVVVTLVGPVDTPAATRLAAMLSDLIDGQGNLAIAVDLSDVRGVGPSGLQVLSEAASDLERRGGRLSLCEAHQAVLAALQLAGLGRFIGRPLVDEAARSQTPVGDGHSSRRPNTRATPDHPAGSGSRAEKPTGRQR